MRAKQSTPALKLKHSVSYLAPLKCQMTGISSSPTALSSFSLNAPIPFNESLTAVGVDLANLLKRKLKAVVLLKGISPIDN